MKYGPVVAMVALLALGAWLVWGPLTPPTVIEPGAGQTDVVVASTKCVLEFRQDAATGGWTFHWLGPQGHVSEPFGEAAFIQMFGEELFRRVTVAPRSPVLRFFKITSWTNLLWISVGLAGQVAFSGRMIYQWWVSERRQESVVPVAFWWMSLGGGACLFSYFIWRQDFVGILGQAPGVVVYARNLWMIYRPRPLARLAP